MTDLSARINPRNHTLADIEAALRAAAIDYGVPEASFAQDLEIPTDQKAAILRHVRALLWIDSKAGSSSAMSDVKTFGDLYSYCRGYFGLADPRTGTGTTPAPSAQPEPETVQTGSGGSATVPLTPSSATSPVTTPEQPTATTSSPEHRGQQEAEQGTDAGSVPLGAGSAAGDPDNSGMGEVTDDTVPTDAIPGESQK